MEVVYNGISKANKALLDTLKRPNRLMKVLAVEMRNQYNQHFAEVGKPYSNLIQPYLSQEAGDSYASAVVTGIGGAIYCHKIRGGTITPKTAKYLAIPLTSKAKKWGSPKERRSPELILTKRGRNFFLQERSYIRKVGKRWKVIRDSILHYILKKSVVHRPDNRAAIAPSRIFMAINARCKDFFENFKAGLKGRK